MPNNPLLKATVKSSGKEVEVYLCLSGVNKNRYANYNDPNSIYNKEELIFKR